MPKWPWKYGSGGIYPLWPALSLQSASKPKVEFLSKSGKTMIIFHTGPKGPEVEG